MTRLNPQPSLARLLGGSALLGACSALFACTEQPPTAAIAPIAAPSASARAEADVAAERCAARAAAVQSDQPGAPGLERQRAQLFARGRAAPVLFLRTPAATPDPAEVARQRRRLVVPRGAQWVLGRILGEDFAGRRELVRQLLLREGYLYAEDPELGAALAVVVRLHDLYRETPLVIERGSRRLNARWEKGRGYVYADGPEAGTPARLWLFDRVWPAGEAEPSAALHVDLGNVLRETDAEQLRVTRLGSTELAVELRYGERWVPALLSRRGTSVSVECVARTDAQRADAERARRERGVVSALRSTVRAMVNEGLPFDEPRTEEGQQDGNLRPAWRWAYQHGADFYSFNGDSYPVFDGSGRPLVPQVCVDFITDVLERSSGTWWTGREATRERRVGRLDFDDLGNDRRSVKAFLEVARSRTEAFEVVDFPEPTRVPFLERAAFVSHLLEVRDRFRAGDILLIFGPRGDENHWHSFYVLAVDPLTGVPTELASNAGRPRIRTFEEEMMNAPRRAIAARIRPKSAWLAPLVELSAKEAALTGGAAESRPAQPPG